MGRGGRGSDGSYRCDCHQDMNDRLHDCLGGSHGFEGVQWIHLSSQAHHGRILRILEHGLSQHLRHLSYKLHSPLTLQRHICTIVVGLDLFSHI